MSSKIGNWIQPNHSVNAVKENSVKSKKKKKKSTPILLFQKKKKICVNVIEDS